MADPRTVPPRRCVLYFHGGAFALCSPGTHRGVLMRLVAAAVAAENAGPSSASPSLSPHSFPPSPPGKKGAVGGEDGGGCGFAVFAVDYRRPPEHPHPAPVDDCVAAYAWLRRYMNGQGEGGHGGGGDNDASQRIVFAGDSAGGALVVSVMVSVKAAAAAAAAAAASFTPNLCPASVSMPPPPPLPAGGLMLSPWVDLTDTGGAGGSESWRANAEFDFLPPDLARHLALAYAGVGVGEGGEAAAATAGVLRGLSATHADLSGLPPLRIYVGGRECLLDQVLAFVAKSEAQGVDVACSVEPGMVHVFVVLAPALPRHVTNRWFSSMARFVSEVTGRSTHN